MRVHITSCRRGPPRAPLQRRRTRRPASTRVDQLTDRPRQYHLPISLELAEQRILFSHLDYAVFNGRSVVRKMKENTRPSNRDRVAAHSTCTNLA